MAVVTTTVGSGQYTWTDITMPGTDELKQVSEQYNLNEFTLRDCLEPDHLPKSEDLGNTRFLITRILLGPRNDKLHTIQEISTKLAIFYNNHFIITVHRLPHPFLETVRSECVSGKCSGPADLVVRILWHVLHSYDQPAILLSDEVDRFEEMVFRQNLTPAMMQKLHFIRQQASVCRRLLMLTGDVIGALRLEETAGGALQDLKDLQLKLLTFYEQAHEDVTNLLNIYLSLSSQKTNQVMKVLTVFSVFFMPVTFIVGIYGMNFKWMPELEWRYGYPAVMVIMAAVTLAIYLWFRRNRWM